MALTNTELEQITTDFIMADDKKAVDIYFETSWLMEYLMRQQKGIWKRPAGGDKIKVHLRYDGAEAGFYSRNETLSEDDRENITAAFFAWKHAFGNATIYRADELRNAGEHAEVEMVVEKVATAMESCRDMIASNLYNAAGDSSKLITGLLSLCSESSTVAYGEIAEDSLAAQDGTKPWEGKLNSASEVLTLDVIRTLRSDTKFQGKRADLLPTTETLFNRVKSILQVQQQFVKAEEVTKAGFMGLEFEGATIAVDDYCPSGHMFALTTKNIGFAVHAKGYFARTPWEKLTSGAQGRTMKILWDGNMVTNNRKVHKGHSNLTAS